MTQMLHTLTKLRPDFRTRLSMATQHSPASMAEEFVSSITYAVIVPRCHDLLTARSRYLIPRYPSAMPQEDHLRWPDPPDRRKYPRDEVQANLDHLIYVAATAEHDTWLVAALPQWVRQAHQNTLLIDKLFV